MEKIISLFLSTDPKIQTRSVLLDEEVGDKNKKQFITTIDSTLKINYVDEKGLLMTLTLFAEAGTKFDGATIPLGIGKGDMRLQIPSLFHDIMCNNKSLVNYDREFSSQIFEQLLIECEIPKPLAKIMYVFVNYFQKFFCDWKRKDE